MDFRRRPHQRKALQLQQEHVGRGIDGARRAVKIDGEAFTGVENRCDPTTWIMSPAVMYFLARSTFCRKASLVMLEVKGISGVSRGTSTGACSDGCSSSETRRSISPTASS
jgi:hypothetical protein